MTAEAVTMSTIQATLLSMLGALAPEQDLQTYLPSSGIQEALDIDSFDYLNFLIELETLYGITVPEEDYDKLTTLDEVVSYVMDRT